MVFFLLVDRTALAARERDYAHGFSPVNTCVNHLLSIIVRILI